MPPWTRASSLDRSVACPASTHLAQLVAPSERSQDAARWGTMLHHWKETGEWLEDTQPVRRRRAALVAGGVSREDLWPITGAHEVAFALHTANKLAVRCDLPTREEKEAWKLSFDESWITGTCDYLGDLLGEPWVDDLKTGKYGLHAEADPWDLWQMRFYALCAAMFTGADRVHVSLTWWPRYPADGVPLQIWAEPVTATELLGLTLPLLETARRAAVASRLLTPDAQPGDHCTFCKSRTSCPAYT